MVAIAREDIILVGTIVADETLVEKYEVDYEQKNAVPSDKFFEAHPSAKIDTAVGVGGLVLGLWGDKVGLREPFYRLLAMVIGAKHLGRLLRLYWDFKEGGSSGTSARAVPVKVRVSAGKSLPARLK